MTRGAAVPDGMVRVTAGRRAAIVRAAFADDARALLATGSLYDAAARVPSARPLQGRGAVYAIALPVSGVRVVVRRNRHGGLFAALTRDLFLPPTRAPHELQVSDRLRALDVPTPEVVMYGLTPAVFPMQRADVVTRDLGDGCDLGALMMPDVPAGRRRAAWRATRDLVSRMHRAGVRHHDLNVKNIYITEAGGSVTAHLLDVDRVTFGRPQDARIHRANVARLARSARKWRDLRGAMLDEYDLPGADDADQPRRAVAEPASPTST